MPKDIRKISETDKQIIMKASLAALDYPYDELFERLYKEDKWTRISPLMNVLTLNRVSKDEKKRKIECNFSISLPPVRWIYEIYLGLFVMLKPSIYPTFADVAKDFLDTLLTHCAQNKLHPTEGGVQNMNEQVLGALERWARGQEDSHFLYTPFEVLKHVWELRKMVEEEDGPLPQARADFFSKVIQGIQERQQEFIEKSCLNASAPTSQLPPSDSSTPCSEQPSEKEPNTSSQHLNQQTVSSKTSLTE